MKNLLDILPVYGVEKQWIFLYAVCLVFGGLSIAAMVNSFKREQLLIHLCLNPSQFLKIFIKRTKNL